MERYTEKHYDGNGHYLICSGACETLNCGDCGILDKIVDRLAAYEDTGLTPEEVQKMRWIPVEERLPEEIGNYLVVACDEHLPRDERIWNGTIMGEGFCGEEGWDMEYSGYIHDITGMVTHWMPFPDFPKEETDGEF